LSIFKSRQYFLLGLVSRAQHDFFASYVYSSLIISVVFSFVYWNTMGGISPSDFFMSAFLVGHYFIATSPVILMGSGSRFIWGIFLFQICCLAGISVSSGLMGPLFLALVPLVTGNFLWMIKKDARTPLLKNRGPVLIVIFLLLGLSSYKMTGGHWNKSDLYFFAMSLFWSLSLSSAGATSSRKKDMRLASHLVRSTSKGEINATVRRDFEGLLQGRGVPRSHIISLDDGPTRLFFHDLINQTHNVALFLEQSIHYNSSVSRADSEQLLREVKIIQELITQFFGPSCKHKNLDRALGLVDFESCKGLFENLIYTYLPPERAQVLIEYAGGLAGNLPGTKRCEFRIEIVPFYRVLTNIVKNISEAGSTVASFNFYAQKESLVLEVHNKAAKITEEYGGVEKGLIMAILQDGPDDMTEETEHEGLGLDSIDQTVKMMAGKFSFQYENGEWVTKVEIPWPGEEAIFGKSDKNAGDEAA